MSHRDGFFFVGPANHHFDFDDTEDRNFRVRNRDTSSDFDDTTD